MEEPFFNQERLARIAKAGADTGFEYDTEVVPSNCLPGATEYVPGTDPGAYCFYSDLIRDLQKELDDMLDKLREAELANIKKLEKSMENVQLELKRSQKSQKLQQAYEINPDLKGSIVNIQDSI